MIPVSSVPHVSYSTSHLGGCCRPLVVCGVWVTLHANATLAIGPSAAADLYCDVLFVLCCGLLCCQPPVVCEVLVTLHDNATLLLEITISSHLC